MDAIKKKAGLFISHLEHFFDSTISDPLIAGDYFSISWDTDIQMKGEDRKTMSELCVYKTKDGKICILLNYSLKIKKAVTKQPIQVVDT